MILCGSSNLRITALSNCTLPVSVDWSVDDFFREVTSWQQRYDEFARVLQHIRSVDHIAVEVLFYEDLQLNLVHSLARMFESVGLTAQASAQLAESKASSTPQNGWLKRSSEDLRSLLTHYSDIEQALVRGRCVCLLAQLRATNAAVFPPCMERYSLTAHECESVRE